MKTLIVAGALANKPHNGGEAWVRLSWVRGFRQLGFRVFFVEQIAPQCCVDAAGRPCGFRESVNRACFAEVAARFGLEGTAALVCGEGEETFGASLAEVAAECEPAAALINISGHLALPRLMERIARKVYIDIDPGFTQFWHSEGNRGARLDGHTDFFTIGENIGQSDCPIPTGGINWRPVRQPVVLDDWPVCRQAELGRFTTVASWRGPFGPIPFEGRTLGLKVHEFRKFLRLPQLAGPIFEIALAIDPGDDKDRGLLLENGWKLVDPCAVAGGPEEFRGYVQGSGGEFSVAQGVYVETRSGWSSDRTIRYLAAGKPVLVQDTGIGRRLPTGEGLLVFSTIEEAAAGADSIRRDYRRHCEAARHIAETYFDARVTLGRLLEDLGIA